MEENKPSLSFDEWLKIEKGEATEAEIMAAKMPEPTPEPTQGPVVKNTKNNTLDEESKTNLVTFFSVLFLLVLFLVFSDDDSSSSSQNPTFITGEKRTILGDGHLACKSQTEMEYFRKLIDQKDAVAAKKIAINGVVSGECIGLENLNEVIIQEYAVWSGLVRIRKPGYTEEYWVRTDAIRPKL